MPFFDVGGEIPMSMGDVFYSLEYWRDTADRLASWGTILLQHDFLSDYEGNRVMMSGIRKMDTYFKNMAKALQEKGIDIQYCMQLPRNIMESTENPVMVSLQASEDHHVPMAEPQQQPGNPDNHDPYFWKQVIFTSAFYGALGIWPSRDNIQTIADPNAFEDTLLANLLAGSIQLGHRIGECNLALLRHTYREGDETGSQAGSAHCAAGPLLPFRLRARLHPVGTWRQELVLRPQPARSRLRREFQARGCGSR